MGAVFLTTPVGFATDLSKGAEEAAAVLVLLACFVVVARFTFGLAGALRFGGCFLGPFFFAEAAVFFPFVASTLATPSLSPPLLDMSGVRSVVEVAAVVVSDELVSLGHGTSSTRLYSGFIRLVDREESPSFIFHPYQNESNMLVWSICFKYMDVSYLILVYT